MKNLHNIEPSRLSPGAFVGYALGRVYRITATGSRRMGNTWRAQWHAGADGPFVLFAPTLASMSVKLATLPNPYAMEN